MQQLSKCGARRPVQARRGWQSFRAPQQANAGLLAVISSTIGGGISEQLRGSLLSSTQPRHHGGLFGALHRPRPLCRLQRGAVPSTGVGLFAVCTVELVCSQGLFRMVEEPSDLFQVSERNRRRCAARKAAVPSPGCSECFPFRGGEGSLRGR